MSLTREVLKAKIYVLMVQKNIAYSTNNDEIRLLLKSNFNVEPSLQEIEDTLESMWYDENQNTEVLMETEDYFEGY